MKMEGKFNEPILILIDLSFVSIYINPNIA